MSNSTPTRRFLIRLTDGTEIGPLDKKAIRLMAKAGRLRPDDCIRQEGSEKWHLAKSVSGLFEVAASDSGPIPLADEPNSSTPRTPAKEAGKSSETVSDERPLPITGFRRAHVYGIIYLAYFAGVFYLLRGGFSFGAFASADSGKADWFYYAIGCIPGGLAGIFGLCFLGGWMDSACPRCGCLSGRLVDSSEAIGQVYGSTTEQQTATHKDRFGHPLGTTTYDVTVPTVTTVLVHACHCRYCNHRWKDASKETSRA
ncbi:MAG: DUF4339 domain-containing protein [Phycisphaerae bacterium]|nr:DUF4339 domain-containing protein [Phycisphaerae bacterium]